MTNSIMLKKSFIFSTKTVFDQFNFMDTSNVPFYIYIYIVMFSLVPRRGNLLGDKVIFNVNMSL